jgi:DNA recombination protein RmuC
MDLIWLAGSAFIALIFGMLVSRIYFKQIHKLYFDSATQKLQAEIALLQERIKTRNEALEELKTLHDNVLSENKITNERGEKEKELRIIAEERNRLLPGLQDQIAELNRKNIGILNENINLKEKISEYETRLVEEEKQYEEKIAIINEAQLKLSDAFKALSSEALKQNNDSFLQLATAALGKYQDGAAKDLEMKSRSIGQVVEPLKEALTGMNTRINELEKARTEAYSGLREQVYSLSTLQQQLQKETTNLVQALRMPQVRGRWGEIQLRRVVEMAGMLEYCDFIEQQTLESEDGKLRPDMIIRMPNQRSVIIDCKTPLQAYLEALDAADEPMRTEKLRDHARQVRAHVTKLGTKAYGEKIEPAPEFTILFLPGEPFFSAALQHDPGLIEFGTQQKVILATPTTLIAMLYTVARGWREEKLAENAQRISDLGKTMFERVGTMAEYINDLKKGLDKSVESYNKMVGTFETRVMVTARKFKELGVGGKDEIESPEQIERATRGQNNFPD